jgi:hypothetical protein
MTTPTMEMIVALVLRDVGASEVEWRSDGVGLFVDGVVAAAGGVCVADPAGGTLAVRAPTRLMSP